MKRHINVVGAVILREDKILCVQRGPEAILPLKWEFPGGKIEPGETPREALAREIAEELLCGVTVGEEIDVTTYEYDFGVVTLTTFYCTLQDGEPTVTEHAEAKWLPVCELHSLDWAPADIPAVETIQNNDVAEDLLSVTPAERPFRPRADGRRLKSGYTVRQPRFDEAEALAEQHNQAWSEAYADLLPPRFWDQEALQNRISMWGQGLMREDVRSRTRVVEYQGKIIGHATVGKSRDGQASATLELFNCYLLAEHYGSGVAEQMVLQLFGEAPATLWVFENNQRARRFYEKLGFAADGTRKDLGDEEGEELRGIWEIRMTRG